MTFEQFSEEARKLGLEAIDDPDGDEGPEWLACDGARIVVRYDVVGKAFTIFSYGTPADALREAARLLRGDVVGKLREWAYSEIEQLKAPEIRGWFSGDKTRFLQEILAKLDELEGKR